MDPSAGKPSFLRNILVRLFLFGVFVVVVRFAYVVTITGESCSFNDFCFFSVPEDNLSVAIAAAAGSNRNDVVKESNPVRAGVEQTREWINTVGFYTSVFQDLLADGILSPKGKCLCVGSVEGREVYALREIGVSDSIGVHKKEIKSLVVKGDLRSLPFGDGSFDFVFSGEGMVEELSKKKPVEVVSEILRTLKPEGFVVVHLRRSVMDEYSFNSFIDLFRGCRFVKSRDINGLDGLSTLKEIVLRKEGGGDGDGLGLDGDGFELDAGEVNKCSVPGYKRDIVRNAEPLIEEEPLKPWITLKKNARNIKYLTSMVDVSYKDRYVYVDVGARSYGSSIGSWFKKQYPKQNKTFEVYAFEADKAFHEEYKTRKGVKLLPYAAWVRNESLTFEINHDPGKAVEARGRGMGRIQPVKSKDASFDGELDTIQGVDFAEWLKNNVESRDLVVMKMDVEGTEFDLIPRLFETGAICLVDEIFLECHYNRWQRCCPGVRSPKYEKTYGQCLELFKSLREKGVLVHQWW